jgi:dienelactone hydrolase
MRWIGVASLAIVTSAGCMSGAQRIDHLAESANLSRNVISGSNYRHIVYANRQADAVAADRRLVVYLDGDGLPWDATGQHPSVDPTTRHPIALQLLALTPEPSVYVSRPCYQELVDAACTTATWTSARYSLPVVESLAAAIRSATRTRNASGVILVGYSGGGTLAVLVAEKLQDVIAVVTIGANLDTDAWARHHDYLLLADSLNPAQDSHPHPWREVHLQGARDTVVPMATTSAYFSQHPGAQRRIFDEYDHVCCWVDNWPVLFAELQAALQESGYSSRNGPRAFKAVSGKSENTPSMPSS